MLRLVGETAGDFEDRIEAIRDRCVDAIGSLPQQYIPRVQHAYDAL
ncbi:hypothetical protein [Longibacter salinarum]|nr:hypothetical protein [Longibacter salinarum]